MNELNCNRNDQSTSIKSEEEELSVSSSFILQPILTDDQHEKKVEYKLKVPLCISQTYEEQFFDRFHINYYGELEHEGLFLASIRSIPIKITEIDKKSSSRHFSKANNNEDNQLVRAIIRTENNNYDVSEIINLKNEENILQILFAKAELSSIHHYEIIHHIKANEKLLEFDKSNDEQYSNKVGLIFQRLNQSNENEILSNNQMSIEMKNFLNLISERIQLKDFNKYRGDLDIKTNEHGIYSYFTNFENHQIMFNIAPIIPSDTNDQQFIQRKSLIGNAFLCIVFQEEGTLFHPDFIPGKVTQVFITVQPIQIHSQLYYKIEIWRRADIQPIVDPSGGIFKHEESFRNYFLILILNTMNIILKKDYFHVRITQQRQRLKNEYLKKLCHRFYSYSKHGLSVSNNTSDDDLDREKSNTTNRSSSKLHRLSFIPKIIATFTNNRSISYSQSTTKGQPLPSFRYSSSLRQQEDSDRSADTVESLITNSPNFAGLNNETSSSSTSTINNDTINQDHTNLSLINNNDQKLKNNQDTQINLTH